MVLERTLFRLFAVAVALPFGLPAVAAAISLSALCYLPRLWVHVGRAVALDTQAALGALAGPVGVGAVLWAACHWLQTETSGWATLGWAGAILAIAWVIAALIMRTRVRLAISAFTASTV